MYNLNEEEELTHYGQSLAEMEKFNDLVNSDDETEEKGLLSGEELINLALVVCEESYIYSASVHPCELRQSSFPWSKHHLKFTENL